MLAKKKSSKWGHVLGREDKKYNDSISSYSTQLQQKAAKKYKNCRNLYVMFCALFCKLLHLKQRHTMHINKYDMMKIRHTQSRQ